ncbi:MAG TPA: hypothetical protein PKM36_11800 [Propionibacteriaceae bacterium]|nr:hypothetical protein [Propionibacteriaceae bacterium]
MCAELFADASIESHEFLENPAGPEYNPEMLQVRIGSLRLQIMGAHRDPMVEYTDAISLSIVVADQAALDKVWDGFLARVAPGVRGEPGHREVTDVPLTSAVRVQLDGLGTDELVSDTVPSSSARVVVTQGSTSTPTRRPQGVLAATDGCPRPRPFGCREPTVG